jgi:hypothetical protein
MSHAKTVVEKITTLLRLIDDSQGKKTVQLPSKMWPLLPVETKNKVKVTGNGSISQRVVLQERIVVMVFTMDSRHGIQTVSPDYGGLLKDFSCGPPHSKEVFLALDTGEFSFMGGRFEIVAS